MKRLMIAAVGLALVAGIVLMSAFPGANGTIAFASDSDGNDAVRTMNADGTGQTRITDHPLVDDSPDWQPLVAQESAPPGDTRPHRSLAWLIAALILVGGGLLAAYRALRAKDD